MRSWLRVAGIERASAQDLEYLERFAEQCQFDPDEMAAVISIESGWRPDAHNAIRAGGLIGFMPSTLYVLGWHKKPEEFWQLSIAEQLPWVARYYQRWCGRISRPGDLYLATFWPAAIGASDEHVIAAEHGPNGLVWTQNPGLRDGKVITAGSVRRVVLRVLERARGRPRYLASGATAAEALSVGVVLAIVITAALWRVMRRRAARMSSEG